MSAKGYLNVYVLTARRDRPTLETFLSAVVDRGASEDLAGTDLMMVPLGHGGALDPSFDGWEWRPCASLDEAIQIGLGPPSRAFTIPMTASLAGLHHPTLTFTRDDRLVFGVAVEDDDEAALPAARVILADMMMELGGTCGLVVAEHPPPLDEGELRGVIASGRALAALEDPLED